MRLRILAVLGLSLVVTSSHADVTCVGAGCPSTITSASPTFTGTTTIDRLKVAPGSTFTCSVVGAGGAASCARTVGTSSAGRLTVTTDALEPAISAVLITVTFSSALASDAPICVGTLRDGTGTWPADAVLATVGGTSTTCVFRASTVLTAGGGGATYSLDFIAIGY